MITTVKSPDRRSSPRFEVSIDGAMIGPNQVLSPSSTGRILNIGRNGLMLMTNIPVMVGASMYINFPIPDGNRSLQLLGKAVWIGSNERNEIALVGFNIDRTLCTQDALDDFLSLLSKTDSIIDRRDDNNNNEEFPVKIRKDDYWHLSQRSPYFDFFFNLRQISDEQKIKNVIVSKPLAYLQKKIRDLFPEPFLVTSDQLHEQLSGETLIILNMDCRRRHEPFTLLDFEEYFIKSNGGEVEPNATLARVSRSLSDFSPITILSIGGVQTQWLATKFLHQAKYENVEFVNHHVIRARKRPLRSMEFQKGRFILQEVQSKKAIERIQEFASKMFAKEFNFSEKIDNLFTNHSDFFVVTESSTGKLMDFARITWHLPNLVLPCMLANMKGSELHLQLNRPDDVSYGEVFAPYINSLSTVRVYRELVKAILSYGEEGFIDVAFTTCDADDKATCDFYSRYFGFKDTGATLNYGTFGGNWKLIYLSKKFAIDVISNNFLLKEQLRPSTKHLSRK